MSSAPQFSVAMLHSLMGGQFCQLYIRTILLSKAGEGWAKLERSESPGASSGKEQAISFLMGSIYLSGLPLPCDAPLASQKQLIVTKS